MLDIDDSPDHEEIAAVLGNQKGRITHWKKRSFHSGLTFLVMVGLTSLFLAGMPIHSLWEGIGKYILLSTYPAMFWALYCVMMLWGAHSQHCEFKKMYTSGER